MSLGKSNSFSCSSIQLVGSYGPQEPELIGFMVGEEEASLPCTLGKGRVMFNLGVGQLSGEDPFTELVLSSHTDQLVATEH